jgi:hypothetical protein
MPLQHDAVVTYHTVHPDFPQSVTFRLRVYETLHFSVVVATELPEHRGAFLTDIALRLAPRVCADHGLDPAHTLWIEDVPWDAARFAVVAMDWDGERYHDPTWTYVAQETVDRLARTKVE